MHMPNIQFTKEKRNLLSIVYGKIVFTKKNKNEKKIIIKSKKFHNL